MPKDAVFKGMNAVHRTLLAVTRGRVGWTYSGMPALELTTTGRKTGQRRSVMLTSPVQQGDSIVLVASRGGDPQSPGWFHNLVADPVVEVSWQGRPAVSMRARVATAAERAALWPSVVAAYHGYGDYQARTTREIPLVILEPASSSPA